MIGPLLILIVAVFFLAGFVKGVIGLGLPPVAMGLLVVAMPPTRALALVIVPGILTNIWQTLPARIGGTSCAGFGRCCWAWRSVRA